MKNFNEFLEKENCTPQGGMATFSHQKIKDGKSYRYAYISTPLSHGYIKIWYEMEVCGLLARSPHDLTIGVPKNYPLYGVTVDVLANRKTGETL